MQTDFQLGDWCVAREPFRPHWPHGNTPKVITGIDEAGETEGADWWPEVDFYKVNPDDYAHTPADLAMALELAELAYASNHSRHYEDAGVANWLRAEVIAALYEGEAR